jgi:hypothetical protein
MDKRFQQYKLFFNATMLLSMMSNASSIPCYISFKNALPLISCCLALCAITTFKKLLFALRLYIIVFKEISKNRLLFKLETYSLTLRWNKLPPISP